jgi:ankyrin repeat protein
MLLQIPNVEINVQNKLGDTALHNAAWKNHPEIVQMLLERGMSMQPCPQFLLVEVMFALTRCKG